jgi:uncharacterized protein with NAD-binding domain and iron-sulfur cluster
MEAGIKGMWWSYPAIEALLAELGIDDALTDWSTSGFWAPRPAPPHLAADPARPVIGELINRAPVFNRLPRLPTPLGQMVWTADAFATLSLADRLSVVGIVAALADVKSSPARYAAMDKMTARELFKRLGVTEAVYRDFLAPTLQVALFAPPEQLSAAETLACLDFYALAHQQSFDVRWCRGSVAERVLAPLVARIGGAGGSFKWGHAVERVDTDGDRAVGVVARDRATGAATRLDVDAVVMAVGIKGMKAIVAASPGLAARDEFRATASLRTIDCLSARLWFDAPTPTRFPANVLAGFDGPDVGATFFNLNAIQDDYRPGGASSHEGCVACDWYGAADLLPLSDAAIVDRALANLRACEPGFRYRTLIDAAVARAPGAVTHFSPGSLSARPRQTTSFANVFIAGDYVRDAPTVADGLSQERAYVTGLAAAGLACEAAGVGSAPVIPAPEPDEPHIALAKRTARAVRGAAERWGLRGVGLP